MPGGVLGFCARALAYGFPRALKEQKVVSCLVREGDAAEVDLDRCLVVCPDHISPLRLSALSSPLRLPEPVQ